MEQPINPSGYARLEDIQPYFMPFEEFIRLSQRTYASVTNDATKEGVPEMDEQRMERLKAAAKKRLDDIDL